MISGTEIKTFKKLPFSVRHTISSQIGVFSDGEEGFGNDSHMSKGSLKSATFGCDSELLSLSSECVTEPRSCTLLEVGSMGTGLASSQSGSLGLW